ncbi:LPS-assembly lipoprotein LptE [Thiothrix subterranea]|uniref:LPS-assembly lipoprotein LptE n=1 Tax=Thiothrix subterranea TaxID=2735563 RepID=A0AA51MKF4_9GAMM|nr:LPS assembly lipoprotein LptE [Thiothrix subterranea]MDQ5767710.1 LPS assembly lipoprotein LptE [Thiothrix subterranea]WML85515.1 LPS assembly lipoprotein LptE [Thiothrix subterranea]
MKTFILALSLLLLLSACGGEPFHLRGSKPLPELMLQGIYLQGLDPQNDFALALRDGLENAGAILKENPQDAATTLTIKNVRENRSVSGYSSTRQVREFNHSVTVDFTVKTPALTESVERSVNATRSQVYDGKYVLGTAEEETIIKEELRREAVRLILLRLQALK